MNSLEHLSYQLCLGAGRDGEYIAVKVDGTPLVLVFSFGKYSSHSLQYTKTLVANHQFNAIQATAS